MNHPPTTKKPLNSEAANGGAPFVPGRQPASVSIGSPINALLITTVVASSATSLALVGQRLALADVLLALCGVVLVTKAVGTTSSLSSLLPFLASGTGFLALNLAHLGTGLDDLIAGIPLLLGPPVVFLMISHPPKPRPITYSIIAVGLVNTALGMNQLASLGRSHGAFRFANELGFFGAALILFALFTFSGTSSVLVRLAIFVGGAGSLLASVSRTSSLAALLLILLFLVRQSRFAASAIPRLILAVGSALWMSATLGATTATWAIFDGLVSRTSAGLEQLETPGDFFYFDNWREGWELGLTSPIFGVGADHALVPSASLSGSFIIHNTILGVWATTGLVGVLLVTASFFTLFRTAMRMATNAGRKVDLLPLSLLLLPKLVIGAGLNTRTLWISIALHLAYSTSDSHKPTRAII